MNNVLRRVRIANLAAASAAALLLTTPVAFANGRFPASNQLLFSPSDANLVVLRATFGIVISHDGGATWRWLCEDVLGVSSSTTVDPLLGLTASGGIVAAPLLTNGLAVSGDTGCNWSTATGPLANQLVKDFAVRREAPDIVVALTSAYSQDAGPEGGPGYVQQTYQSINDGADWSAIGTPIDPTALATTIEVAPSDAARLYVSAVRGADATRAASLFVSTSGGADWIERPVALDSANETAIYIAAVDPTSADRVYLRTAGSTAGKASRLLVTNDAGLTFAEVLKLSGQMLGFALSPDGAKVYAGSAEQGLFIATRDGLSFHNTSTIHVQCLATRGTELWACSDEASGFIAGVSIDDGATFKSKLHLVAQPLIACSADAAATVQCGGASLRALCQSLPGCDGGTAMAPVATRSGGCSTIGQANLGLAAAGAFIGLALCGCLRFAYRRAPKANR
ncbi:MAG TPA: hypothetical protein VGY54_25160 [Polyangiaceae bacterium]|jgi:hypothetical protein|nr:hypothetical protein [Polyangiaceae bacterium]